MHAFTVTRGGTGGAALNMEKLPAGAATYYRVRYDDLYTNSPKDYDSAATKSRLDWVGRYHGASKKWETKKTNFLYCDGHAETKAMKETLDPGSWQWGDRMYSLATSATVTP